MNPNLPRRCGVLALALSLTACAELDQMMAGWQSDTPARASAAPRRAAEHISDTLQKICQVAAQNPLRATTLYEEKILTAKGVVGLIQEGFYTRKDLVNDKADEYSVLMSVVKQDRGPSRTTTSASWPEATTGQA